MRFATNAGPHADSITVKHYQYVTYSTLPTRGGVPLAEYPNLWVARSASFALVVVAGAEPQTLVNPKLKVEM